MSDAAHLATPSWNCVHFADQAPDPDALTAQGIVVADCNASGVADDKELLDAVGEALSFPAYFGRNWDALDEMLRDLEWLPAEGWVLVVTGSRKLWTSRPETAAKLLRAWPGAARRWAGEDRGFHLVFVW
jgi:hypothetical protein